MYRRELTISHDIAGTSVRFYKREHGTNQQEPWLTDQLTASYEVYTTAIGGSQWSEGTNAESLAEQEELPVEINPDEATITVHGRKIDIDYVAAQLDNKGFTEE